MATLHEGVRSRAWSERDYATPFKKQIVHAAFVQQTYLSLAPEAPADIFPALVETMQCVISTQPCMLITETIFRAARSEISDQAAVDVARWLDVTYSLDHQGMHRAAARAIMQFVEGSLHINELTLCNRLLMVVDIEKLSSRSLLGLIRSTARVRKNLPAWSELILTDCGCLASQCRPP